MVDTLPPLSALRVFESAARHLNFTRAAGELGMTQAAVSYQIKILEERIGTPLFLRQPRRLVLTDTGERLAPGIIEAFALMRSSVAAGRTRAHALLNISTMQTFASNWLVHRIGAFQLQHPDIAVKFDVNSNLVDFARDPVDVGIRSGQGNWPGLEAHLVVRAEFTPMMTPELARRVRKPADLLDLPLIDRRDKWWSIWFAAAGIDYPEQSEDLNLILDSQSLVGNLARAGKGVAVLTPVFFRDELQRGELVQPFELVCTRGFGYYLAYPHARRNAPHIAAFRNWILTEAPALTPVDGTIVTPMGK